MTTVFVPCDTSALACGGDDVARAFAGQSSGQGAVDIVRNGSRGLCWAEPMVELLEAGGTRLAFGNVEPGDATDILKQRDAHPKCLGAVESIDYLAKQHRLVFDRCGSDAPLALPTTTVLDGLLREPPDYLAEIEASGLRGRGGAAFPAHIKWRTVRDTPAERKYVVCNADEGDSGTFADRLLMEGDPFRLIEGMVIAGIAVGATQGFIYLRSEYPYSERTLEAAIEAARQDGVLGDDVLGSGKPFHLEVVVGAGAYICGEETSLLDSLEGKRGEARFKPPVPAISGLFGSPTLVHNVISLASVPGIFEHGGNTYGGLGVAPSSGTMPFQLAGNIRRGGLIELPFGATLADIIHDFGGGTRSGRPVRTVQIGGPLGAYLREEEFDTPLTYEAIAELGAGIGHGGIVVFDDTVDLAEQARHAFHFCAVESCGKCTPCRVGSVRGRETMDIILQGRGGTKERELIIELCDVMEEASLCQLGGMAPIPVTSAMQRFPEDFER